MTEDDSLPRLPSDLRVAIVHYWFVGCGGGERVIEALAEIFPRADIHALVADSAKLPPALAGREVKTSFLQHVPGARRFHRHFFPLQAIALEQFDLSQYELVISSESGPAKGVITPAGTCHVCYCHSPMRYIWEMYPEYRRGMNRVVGLIYSLVAHYMRIWDYASAGRVDYFVANSHFTASRIRKYYRRQSSVIYPPVGIDARELVDAPGKYYLAVGRLVDYKRMDLAVEACTRLGRELRVIGEGPQYKALRRMAGPTVTFLGRISDEEVDDNLRSCRALLFPGTEDFGLVPVEAQSFGRPVIAYAAGGALESIRGTILGAEPLDNPTGIFFTRQSSEGLAEAILTFESKESEFHPETIRQHSRQFNRSRFKREMAEFIQSALKDFRAKNSA